MMLVSIGDQITEGEYAFHSRFDRAVNFQHDGHLISVVDEQIGAGPLNIVVRDLNAGPAGGTASTPSVRGARGRAPSLPLEITADTVVFEGCRFRFTDSHRYDSRIDFQARDPSRFQRNLSVFEKSLRTASPPNSLTFLLNEKRIENFRPGFERSFVEQVKHSVHQIFGGNLLEGVRSLRGCGLGLTPSGDDFIAGLLIGLNLLQKMRKKDFQHIADAVFKTAKAGNVFSNTFLHLARRGLLFARMKELILSLVNGTANAVRKATETLFAVGETSGADLGTGFLMTMRIETDVLRRWGDGVGNLQPLSVS